MADTKYNIRPLGDTRPDSGEKLLESLVLGGDEKILRKLDSSVKDDQRKRRKPESKRAKKQKRLKAKEKEAVWEDDEDDDDTEHIVSADKERKLYSDVSKSQLMSGEKYVQRLKSEFEKVTATPNWAKLKHERDDSQLSDDSDTDELKKTTGNRILRSKSLSKGILQIKRCTNVNRESPGGGKLKAVEFHPSAQVALTAGLDQRLSLFQIDGKTNAQIQSVFIEKFPIYSAHFSSNGEEVITTSRCKAFYYYDMIAGKIVNVPWIKACEESNMRFFEVSPDGRLLVFRGQFGRMHLISAKTKEYIQTLKMNGSCHSICFNRDGSTMYSYGDDGEVYVWDMNARDCVHKFVDEGCIHGHTIDASINNQYIACGSESGVVNIYDAQKCMLSTRPSPVKAIMNMTTTCTQVKFNSSSEMLAIASNYSERGVKLVHVPSMTVFSNFPDPKMDQTIRIPINMDFSVNSGYFTIGNNKGSALLYRLKHYSNF